MSAKKQPKWQRCEQCITPYACGYGRECVKGILSPSREREHCS